MKPSPFYTRALRWAVPALAAVTLACAHKPPTPVVTNPDGTVVETPPEPKPEEEKVAQALYDDAAALAQKGDHAGAKAKEDELLGKYPSSLAAARLFEEHANAAAEDGRLQAAIAWYEKLLFYRPSYPHIARAREAYAGVLLKVGRHADAAAMYKALYAATESATDKARLGPALATALAQAGEAKDALEILVDLGGNSSLPAETRERATNTALEIIESALTFKEAEDLWDKVEDKAGWSALQPALAFKLAKVYLHIRQFKEAEAMLSLVATRFEKSPYAAPARELSQRLKARFVVDNRVIGLILPLSGKYKQYGERSLAAVKLALATDKSFKLVVKDTQGEPTAAARAVEELVIKDHAVAIIGPLFSSEAQAAALKAEELSVPLVALNHREGLPELGPFVFRTALTIEAQAQELARVAFETLGMSRFALLYPRNSYGTEFANAFWDEVERRKGEIRAAETYEIDQTTFMEPIKKLVGRWYIHSRAEFREMYYAMKAKKLPSHREASELEKIAKGLPPVIDFDAIVIPDSAKNIGLIAPALAFEDIVLTQDPKELEKIRKATGNKKVKPVTLLGASTWNSPQTVESCEQYCEGAVFVDAYYPDNPEPKVRDFVAAYHEAAGIDPSLSEAQAFDTAAMLKKALLDSKATDRTTLRDQLVGAMSYDGVTGKLRFDKEGEAKKDLFVLTIQEGVIRLWQPPAATPQG